MVETGLSAFGWLAYVGKREVLASQLSIGDLRTALPTGLQFPGADDLGLEVMLERITLDLIEAARQMGAGVTHHDIDPAEGFADIIDEPGDISWFTDIGDETFGVRRFDRGHGLIEPRPVASANRDATAFRRKRL